MSADFGPSGSAIAHPYTPAQGGGDPALGGDLSGTASNATVDALQGHPLNLTDPLTDDGVLTYDLFTGSFSVEAPASTPVPWTSVIYSAAEVTTGADPVSFLAYTIPSAAGGTVFRSTVTATYRDQSAMYAWDIIATVNDDGAGTATLRDVVITPSDPGGPLTLSVTVAGGTTFTIASTGIAATTIDWQARTTRAFNAAGV